LEKVSRIWSILLKKSNLYLKKNEKLSVNISVQIDGKIETNTNKLRNKNFKL
jgi:hypothetical protein